MTEQKEYFEFLDDLRDLGITNMFGAAPYIQEEFGITKQEAKAILKEWMASKKLPANEK